MPETTYTYPNALDPEWFCCVDGLNGHRLDPGGPLDQRFSELSSFGAQPMNGQDGHRWAEFREVPGIVLRQAENLSLPMAELVLHLRQRRPSVIVTCARGSSANAATFGKHLIENHIGIPVATVAPSIA